MRRGIYLQLHPDMTKANTQFEQLRRKGRRNPLMDCQRILATYGVEVPVEIGGEELEPARVMQVCRRVAKAVEEKQEEVHVYRSKSRSYARTLAGYKSAGKQVSIPVLESRHLEAWASKMLIAAMEDLLPELGGIPEMRRRCPRGCHADENAYHVATSCVVPDYVNRHNFAVYWVSRALLEATRAPPEVRNQLRFGSATLNAEYVSEIAGRQLTIRAGGFCAVDVPIYHYKPDVVVRTSNPRKVYVLEASVAHFQNLEDQEILKCKRYGFNSAVHITPDNVNDVLRGENLVNILKRTYGCEVELGVMVVGCFGEIIQTAEMVNMERLVNEMGVSRRAWKSCLSRCSFSIATAKILVRRCHEAVGGRTAEGRGGFIAQ